MAAVGCKIVYYENNKSYDGEIKRYNRETQKHTIVCPGLPSSPLHISLKQARKEAQLMVIDKEHILKDIIPPTVYFNLYLNKYSARHTKAFIPTRFGASESTHNSISKDPLQYAATWKAKRPDIMFQQKFAYASTTISLSHLRTRDRKKKYTNDLKEQHRFKRLITGSAYELKNGKMIIIEDIECSNGTQIVTFRRLLKLILLFLYFSFCLNECFYNDFDCCYKLSMDIESFWL